MKYRFRYWLARYRLWRTRKKHLRNPYADHLVARWYAEGAKEFGDGEG